MTKKETADTKKEEVSENLKAEEIEQTANKSVKAEGVGHGTASKRKSAVKEKELELKLKEQQDKYLRLSADFDNYRKRVLKERIENIQYAGIDIFSKILPVLDDFERAITSMKETQDISAIRLGIELIYNKFRDYLSQQGIQEINALHQEFNTDYHEAVTEIPAPENELKGKVVEIIEKGYKLNDKVIRYSKVVVGA